MPSRHRVSRAAIDLLKRFEGYRRQAAQLPDGRWTIGYGHTLTAREGAEVSETDAEALLVYDLIAVQHAINENVFSPLTQNQFDALSSFAFNVGLDNFRRSQVLKRINGGAMVQAACAMELWRKADFQGERIIVDALVRRRAVEKALFLTPPGEAWVPAPSSILRPVLDLDALELVPATRPVALEASFDGVEITVSRGPDLPAQTTPTPAPPAAVTATAAAVTQRLETLFADPGQEPDPDALIDLRPQADFAPPITPEPVQPSEPKGEPEPEPDAEAERGPDSAPDIEPPPAPAPQPDAGDAELDIPQAPAFQRFERPDRPQVEMEVQPFAFIPARPRPAPRPKEPAIAWDLMLALLGLAFFGFGLFWGLYAQPTGGAITPIMVAWPAGMAGVGFSAVAVYRLLQRLGREAERD